MHGQNHIKFRYYIWAHFFKLFYAYISIRYEISVNIRAKERKHFKVLRSRILKCGYVQCWFHFLPRPSTYNTARDCRSSVCRQVGLSADSEHNSSYFPSLFPRTGYPTSSCNSSTVGARSPITLSTPSLPSTPLSRPAQVHHSFRFGDGMNKKSCIFDPPLIVPYL